MQGRRFELNRKTLSIILCIVLISVFSLTIAYAALSVTLNITGSAEISDASWNVHFDNVKVNSASVEITPKITNNTTLTFSASLVEPGDFYKFNVDIVNDGTIDAMIDSIITTPELTTEQKKYLRYEVEYTDGNSISTKQILKSKEIRTISVLFSFRTDIPTSDLPTSSTNFDVQIQLVYYQADNTATSIPEGNIIKVVSGNLDTIGSEICIDEECFYVISSTDKTVTMFSKYNLYAGGKYLNNEFIYYGEEATGKQDSNMVGYPKGTGVIPFSKTQYWLQKTIEYPSYVFNQESELYIPLEKYKQILESKSIKIEDIRLIKDEELKALGCNQETTSCTNTYSWLYSTSYWSGTARVSGSIIAVNADGHYSNAYFGIQDSAFGVRPVIEIPLTEF